MTSKTAVGIWIGASLALALAVAAAADTLVLTDGRTFEGRLVSRTDEKVVFEVHQFGTTMVVSYPAEKVRTVKTGKIKPKTPATTTAKPEAGSLPPEPKAPPLVTYDGPTYYVIPLHGQVGTTILASLLEKSLDDALRRKPDVVVLDVKSPGGTVAEGERIIDVIRRYQGSLRIVTFAGKALSAAAVLSLATKEIYMTPAGLIGAATAYKLTSFRLPAEISEKFQSTWRAAARSSAETGGHSPLLAEAMIDNQIELHWVEQNGKKTIRRGRGRNTITRKGKLLTLTAGEAIACGLAAGKAGNYHELGAALRLKAWTECKGLGTLLASWWTRTIETFSANMRREEREFQSNIRSAMDSRPDQPRYAYRYYQRTLRFTPDAQKQWRERSVTCARYLRKAQKNVKAAIAMTEKMGEMEALANNLKEMLSAVKSKADTIYRDRYNYTVRKR